MADIHNSAKKFIYDEVFTSTGAGDIIDFSNRPMKHFAIKVKTSGVVTAWVVRLQVDLEGTDWTTIASHTTANGSGQTIFVSTPSPSLFVRANCTTLDLIPGGNITVKIIGME